MNYLLVFIGVFALLGFGMLAWRWREITRRVIYTNVLSREFGLLVSTMLFVIIALIVGIGTSMPVISMLPGFGRQVSVDLAWYGPNIAPFGLILLLTMAIGPLLGWQQSRYGSLVRLLKWPTVLTAVVLFGALLLNVIYPVALLFIGAAVFAALANAAVIIRIWRTGPLRLGGYLAHIGVGLLFVGIVGTAVYKQSVTLRLTEGVPQTVFDRQFTLRGMVIPNDDPLKRTALQIEVMDPKRQDVWLAQTPFYIYAKTGQQVMHPDIQPGVFADLYLAPSQFEMPAQVEPGLLYMGKETTREAFGYSIMFKEFELPNRDKMIAGQAPPEVFAILDIVAPDGTKATVKPKITVVNQEMQAEPVTLAGGATLKLETVDPQSGLIALRFDNVDLSSVPPEALKAVAFLEVSREPGIKFVWAGFIVGIIGGVLAMIRRWREARPSAMSTALPAPKPRAQPEVPTLVPGLAPIATLEREVQQ